MTVGLAEAGADIVGVDYVEAPETKEMVESLVVNTSQYKRIY